MRHVLRPAGVLYCINSPGFVCTLEMNKSSLIIEGCLCISGVQGIEQSVLFKLTIEQRHVATILDVGETF